MTVFRRLFYAALCAGLVAGLVVAIAHQFGTVPLILQAEVYEEAAQHPAGDSHPQAAAAEESSAPEGLERTIYTVIADLLAAVGFGLLLAAGFTLRGGGASWRQGL